MDYKLEYSIVMTVYNDEDKILALLENIQSQTYMPNEIVIVDGGSHDNTCKIIKEYDESIKLISGCRYNIAQGLNRAIKETTNKWIGIIATGNSYNHIFFEALIKAINENPSLDGAYGIVRGKDSTLFEKLYSKEMMKEDWGIPTNHGLIINKDVFDQVGFFYENLVYAGEDAEFYRRACRAGKKFQCVNEAIVLWDMPQNYCKYFKQTYLYTLGEMQMISNKNIIAFYGIKNILFCFINFFTLPAILIGFPMPLIFFLLTIIIIGDLRLLSKGWTYFIAWYIRIFTKMVCVFLNIKYLKKQNKIDNKYWIG